MRCERCQREFPSPYHFRTKTICHECLQSMSPEERKSALEPKGIHRLTTTAFGFDGYRVTQSFGLVRGITVRSRSIFGTIGASLQTLIGGNIYLTQLNRTVGILIPLPPKEKTPMPEGPPMKDPIR